MTTNDAFKLADQLARSLGDRKHQFGAINYSPTEDKQKLEQLHLGLIHLRREIIQVELMIFGEVWDA